MRTGKIILNGVKPVSHELDTILFFTNLGKDVELIPPSNTPHNRRADFIMNGVEWEMKGPQENSRIVVERIFHKALRQSNNVIIDLRRTKGREKIAISHLEKCFLSSKKVKRLIIITKNSTTIDFTK